jgi:HK97 family phage portal protein
MPLTTLLKKSKLQTRAIDSFQDYPGLTEQLLSLQGLSEENYTVPSVREALSVPAVFRAVTMISTLIGSLTLEAWRNGTKMSVAPSLVQRPGVFSTPRDFFRDTGWCLANYGEYLWWVVDRDEEGLARKLLIIPPGECQVTWDDDFPLMRRYRWRNKDIPAEDIEHGTYVRNPASLRGMGPLQLCGAALSAAVEADKWAARFFRRGGAPATKLNSPVKLNQEEANRMVDQYLLREGNEVRVLSGGVTAEAHAIDPESAQLLQSRQYSASAVATMFGMDADLLNSAISGSSLTYQNVGQRFDNFVRSSLAPGYLEPIEHGISERLTRTTVARFNLQTLLRADVKTQAEVFSTLTAAGMSATDAATVAGLDNLVDTQPVPAPLPVPDVVEEISYVS